MQQPLHEPFCTQTALVRKECLHKYWLDATLIVQYACAILLRASPSEASPQKAREAKGEWLAARTLSVLMLELSCNSSGVLTLCMPVPRQGLGSDGAECTCHAFAWVLACDDPHLFLVLARLTCNVHLWCHL